MRILLSFIFIFISQLTMANKIDEIKNDEDVVKFYKANAPRSFTKNGFRIIPDSLMGTKAGYADVIESLGMKSWQKADFNSDGLTDILINVLYGRYNSVVFIDKGNGKFDINVLSTIWWANCQFGTVINFRGKTGVMMYTSKQIGGTVAEGYAPVITTDTVVYEYGAFAELNNKPRKEPIASIVFYITGCLGDCQAYELKINANREAVLSFTNRLNDEKIIQSRLKDTTLNQIFGYIAYLDVKKLKDNYSTATTDSRTVKLTVTFKDGTVKRITDYGLVGTYGLSGLYKIIANFTKLK